MTAPTRHGTHCWRCEGFGMEGCPECDGTGRTTVPNNRLAAAEERLAKVLAWEESGSVGFHVSYLEAAQAELRAARSGARS